MLDSLHNRWHSFRTELRHCRKQFSEESVHDLRVATRRLISTLELVDCIQPEAQLRKARRALKKHLDRFGPLRDVHVQLLTIDKMLSSFPELQGFYDFLSGREGKLTRRLGSELRRVKTRKIGKRIVAAVKRLEALPDTPTVRSETCSAAVRAIETAYNQVIERKQAITPAHGSSIHRMRVAFKKFRYMVEALGPLQGRTSSKQLKAMNAFQDSMGDIQDAEVLFANVQSFARTQGVEGGVTLLVALEELSRRRTVAIDTFLASVDTVFTFWKPLSKGKGVR
jgi:CHAD domain-containing protein